MTTLLDSEIKYSRITKDYDILICGQIAASAPNYSAAEAIRTQLLSERMDDGLYATASELDGGALSLVESGLVDQPLATLDAPVATDPDEQIPPPWDGPCGNCGGAHHVQKCPEIAEALHYPDAGAAIARQYHRDRHRFLAVLRNLDRDAWCVLAEAYAAYLSRFGTWIRPEHVIKVWAMAVDETVDLPKNAA